MGINITTPSFINNPNPDTFSFQDWFSNTPTGIYYQSTNGTVPLIPTIPVKIKDVIGTQAGDVFPTKRLYVEKEYLVTNQTDWLSCFFSNHIISNSKTFAYENGMEEDLVMSLQNVLALPSGIYSAKVIFKIQGQYTVFGAWNTISSYEHIINLTVSETNAITWLPTSFNLSHVQNTPFPFIEIQMGGDNWKLESPANYILESPNNDVLITNSTIPLVGTIYTAQSSGNKIVIFTLSPFFNSPLALGLSPFLQKIKLWFNNNIIGDIFFNISILANYGFVVSPDILNYQAYKNIQEATPIELNIFTSLPYYYSKPAWIIMDVLAEYAPGIPSKFLVYPIPSNNMSEGSYAEEIVFIADTGIVNLVETVSVSHYVYNNFIIPYNQATINFTKDLKFIDFFTQVVDTFFQISIIVKANDFIFQTGNSINKTIPLKIVLFEYKQKQNIGLLIEKLLFSILGLEVSSNQQYNAALVKIKIKEISFIDQSIINEIITPEYKFLSGLTPSIIKNNCAFLDINEQTPKRVTAKLFTYVNMMMALGIYNVKIIRHRLTEYVLSDYIIDVQTDTYSDVIRFSDFELTKGDVLEYQLNFPDNTFLSKKFIVFRETDYSNMIIWEDEYKLLQSFECTGKYAIKNEYTITTSNLYIDLTDVLKKNNTSKEVTFSLNTGFISSADKKTIESLCESSRAWLYVSENDKIKLTPIIKSLQIQDVDEELISYDLEFKINRQYNEESYTF